jgi:hypothetical protein
MRAVDRLSAKTGEWQLELLVTNYKKVAFSLLERENKIFQNH